MSGSEIERARTFTDCWDRTVARAGDRPFLVFSDGKGTTTQWTYAAFDDVVARLAATLSAAGVGPGTGVHLALRNCPGFVAVWLAVARLGAWFVPVDPSSSARDIRNQCERTSPVVGICAASRADVYREGATSVFVVLELFEDARDLDPGSALLATDQRVDRAGGGTEHDRLAVMFTSGTTAQPKGVVLTQHSYAHVAAVMAELSGTTPRSRWFVTLPLFHANAQYYCFAPAIAAGASVALTATFSASRWVAQARAIAATHASLFAAPMRMILARTPAVEQPLTLEHVWFAQSLGSRHYEDFATLVGCRPRQLYGMTETVAVVTIDSSEPATYDVIGRPVEGRSVRIDGVGLHDAAVGATGELSVLGTPGQDLFARYLDDPATTERVLTPEQGHRCWFSTGDVVAVRADGQLRFLGRVDDVVKVGGENVSLSETEAAVAQAPGVLEAAVVARPDPVRDHVTVAYVVPRDPARPPDPDELDAWAARNLTAAARPREWHHITDLPRTSVGKVRRFEVGAP
ncbi:class I adenylate-forming enzyme family protein [Nocardioides sp. L-11A]|uniref:class I adenylate-forming enzyme family protein n=1 Tax=Nocardioides sp. L-11A TaxID=3043848 RepID=UPI00249C67F9|nr:AMP-binding protein [Nocardioides sp. L-11A]